MTYHTAILGNKRGRDIAHKLIDSAPVNAVVTVKPPKRTIPQNDKFHAMLSDISRACPMGRRMTPDLWKAVIMKACGHAIQFTLGIDGEPFPVGFRSSKLTKDQMSELIEFMYQFGDAHGVAWSDEARQ